MMAWEFNTRFVDAFAAWASGDWWGDKDSLFWRSKNRVCIGPFEFWRRSSQGGQGDATK